MRQLIIEDKRLGQAAILVLLAFGLEQWKVSFLADLGESFLHHGSEAIGNMVILSEACREDEFMDPGQDRLRQLHLLRVHLQVLFGQLESLQGFRRKNHLGGWLREEVNLQRVVFSEVFFRIHDVNDLLEVIRGVFDDNLEALIPLLLVVAEDFLEQVGAQPFLLVGREDDHLGNLRSELDSSLMGLIDGAVSQQILALLFIDQEVLPIGASFYEGRPIYEEREH